MKIAYLINNVFGIGGTIRTVLTQAETLAHRHEVEVVSVFQHRDVPSLPVGPGVRITGLVDVRSPAEGEGVGGRPLYEGSSRAGLPSEYFPPEGPHENYSRLTDDRVKEFLTTTDADVVVGTRAGLNVMIARLAPEHLVTVGQEHLTYHMHSPRIREIMAREYRRLNAFVTVTEADARTFREKMSLPGVRVLSIPNSVPRPPLTVDDRSRRTIVAAGRMADMKRFDLLIDAFARVVPHHPGWRLRIYGKGERLRARKNQIAALGLQDSVFMMGPHSRMDEAWALGSFAAVTSRDEPFGMTIVEAMRAGLPVVSTDCPHGPAEIIRHGEDGLLVTNKDVAAIAEGLDRLMGDDDLRARMSAAALRNSERFDPAIVGQRHEELFCELTGTEPPRTEAVAAGVPEEAEADCSAEVRPDGSAALVFGRPPERVVLRHEEEEPLEFAPDDGTVVINPADTSWPSGTWTVRRVDDGTESPVTCSLIDGRAFPFDPATTKHLGLAIPGRDRDHRMTVVIRRARHHAEVHGVEQRDSRITIRGTALGITAPDPDARLEVALRADPQLLHRAPCPLSATGDFTADIPLEAVTGERREGEDAWDLRVRTSDGAEYRLGRALDGVAGHKRIVDYPAPLLLGTPRGDARVHPYFTVNDRLALRVTDANSGRKRDSVASAVHNVTAEWTRGARPELVLSGDVHVANLADGSAEVRLTGEAGSEITVPARLGTCPAGGSFTARLALDACAGDAPLPFGRWGAKLVLRVGESTAVVALRPERKVEGRRWWRGFRPVRAQDASTSGDLLAVEPVPIGPALRRRARRLLAPVR